MVKLIRKRVLSLCQEKYYCTLSCRCLIDCNRMRETRKSQRNRKKSKQWKETRRKLDKAMNDSQLERKIKRKSEVREEGNDWKGFCTKIVIVQQRRIRSSGACYSTLRVFSRSEWQMAYAKIFGATKLLPLILIFRFFCLFWHSFMP